MSSTTNFRRRKHRAPATPVFYWKFSNRENRNNKNKMHVPSSLAPSRAKSGGDQKDEVSTRKLAAGRWKQRLCAVVSEGPNFGGTNSKVECDACFRLESENKLDLRYSRVSNELKFTRNGMKLVKDQITTAVSVANSPIKAKLMQAQMQIHELEIEKKLFQRKIKHLLKNLEEERRRKSRKNKEFQKFIYDLRSELIKEKKNLEKLTIINSKLVNEVEKVKSYTKRLKEDYNEEKQCKKLLEKVCNELVNKIKEDKLKVEEMKMESAKIFEEIEEERKLLQLAEVWREERVQMKLVDAKLALEDKYNQMNILIQVLEDFLRSRRYNSDGTELREAELIRKAAQSININEINEFSYVPSKANDIYSIIDEVEELEAKGRIV